MKINYQNIIFKKSMKTEEKLKIVFQISFY